MDIRVSKLIKELRIGLDTLCEILKSLGYGESEISPNTKVPEEIAMLIRGGFLEDCDLLKLAEIADIGFDLYQRRTWAEHVVNKDYPKSFPEYSSMNSFWISELMVLSSKKEAVLVETGPFKELNNLPFYSVLIGRNGSGKSSLMKDVVDFFIDLRSCANKGEAKSTGRIKGIKYHIDGVECAVVRQGNSFIAQIGNCIRPLRDLRIPTIVACHFGAFDIFPKQTVNGATRTRYDVPYYKYVGAHVNGSIISSSAIAFRLLFTLNEQIDERQRQNICSILDFIGYEHRITLSYAIVPKARKDGVVRELIVNRVKADKEYSDLNGQERSEIVDKLYGFYKGKLLSNKQWHTFVVSFDRNSTASRPVSELDLIYKLKQCGLIHSVNVLFHKQGCDITSDDMSSGEFAMLSTVLSISAAANDSHTLVLLDEPELSLHPNWQMTLIDNLDKALTDRVCHMLIATHSHMLVADLPMKRSQVTQLERDEEGELHATIVPESTYGWSAEEVLLKVFKTATDRNRYFGERIGQLLERIGNNTIAPEEVTEELSVLQEISSHLNDIDPMKKILNTIVEAYK